MPLKMFAPLKKKNGNARTVLFLIINRLKFAIWEAFATAALLFMEIIQKSILGPFAGRQSAFMLPY